MHDVADPAHRTRALADADPLPLPRPTTPGTGVATARVALPGAGWPARVLAAVAHLRVLGSLTSRAEVVTVLAGSPAVVVRVDLTGSSWAGIAADVARAEAEPVEWEQVRGSGLVVDSAVGGTGEDFPLTVVLDGRDLVIRADRARVHPAVVDNLPGYYRTALAAIADDPSALATGVDLRSADERAAVAAWSTGPELPDAHARTVHAQFRAAAAGRPGAIAVLDPAGSTTYRQLERRVNHLAHRLRALGVGRGDRVGVSVRRGVDLVVGLLGAQAAGAAYLPLDPGFPAERLRFITEDADLACLVVGAGVDPPPTTAPVVHVERAGADEPPEDVAGPGDAAYVMYTSGSTGRPKGTVLEHRNVTNFFVGMDDAIGLSPDDRVLAQTSASFDISVLELLWPLARGATTAICPEGMVGRLRHGPGSLLELLGRFRPTVAQATPSFLTAVAAEPEVLAALGGVRALLVGGELLPQGLAQQLVTGVPGARVVNMYGPTETTIWSLTHDVAEPDTRVPLVPIGRPINRTTLRVVDGLGGDACVGVTGELWIGGDGVARGYFRRPELDAERFTPGPDRHYRTGDLVRWRRDGALEFLGRDDRQVKVRGHRVELDEVESVLSEHPLVEAAAVVVDRDDARGDELVAFVRPRRGREREPVITDWLHVWDASYRAAGQFPGWVDSYTGERIPEPTMADWLGATVRRVRSLGARRVVDVGAGGGLLARSLDGWERYLAIDFSGEALAAAAAALVGRDGVSFREGDARVLAELPAASADVVVLNSVVQYFPDADHLAGVLDEALRVAGPAGAVFVGDVRDARLLAHFHADVQVRRCPRLLPAAELRAVVERHVAAEHELCLTPGFFDAVLARHPGTTARVECRADRVWTEMSRFRWDVTLLGPGHPDAAAPEPTGAPWAPGEDGGLAEHAEAGRVLLDVPNARLVRPTAALSAVDSAADDVTAWEVARSVWALDTAHAVDPAEAHRVAAERGLRAHVRPARSGDPTRLDITFTTRPEDHDGRTPRPGQRPGAHPVGGGAARGRPPVRP
ncbi:amino acid adenylation domain-containing protein [Actinokineospora bangkokensis]|uniref:amino acid adenylation domain-containing protein n=1 Tax=Actinokineospora bangkokensis TaxID=1193682 RepID=UPI000ABF0E6E|nr:amino acid adenylation domain-containing protein [Actinokineospora bangkokensis]